MNGPRPRQQAPPHTRHIWKATRHVGSHNPWAVACLNAFIARHTPSVRVAQRRGNPPRKPQGVSKNYSNTSTASQRQLRIFVSTYYVLWAIYPCFLCNTWLIFVPLQTTFRNLSSFPCSKWLTRYFPYLTPLAKPDGFMLFFVLLVDLLAALTFSGSLFEPLPQALTWLINFFNFSGKTTHAQHT